MGAVKGFEDLRVWQKTRELALVVFKVTEHGKFSKDYGLKNQIRNASGSIMDNIAEGFERNGRLEFIQFLSIAKGSCGETISQMIRACDCGYIDEKSLDEFRTKASELGRMIGNLISYLNKSEIKGAKFKDRS